MSQYQFKTTNIKGKQYVEVNERVKAFRVLSEYAGYSLQTELLHLDADSCVVRATICNADGQVIAQGMAQEDKSSSMINKTSYVENCETSAVGRALGFLGIGIETSIATADEVGMAIAKQDAPAKTYAAPAQASSEEPNVFQQAVAYMKGAKDKAASELAYKQVITKYGDQFSDKQKEALAKFIKKK